MYEQAAELYQQVIDAGLVAPELYYNLGNAYFKQHNIPMAILNYERALQLDPGNEDIKYNLELARTYVSDKIETLPRFFLVEWYHWFLERMSSDGWARFSVIAFMVGLLLLTLFVFSKRFIWRKTGYLGDYCFVLFVIVFFLRLAKSQDHECPRLCHRHAACGYGEKLTGQQWYRLIRYSCRNQGGGCGITGSLDGDKTRRW